MVKHKWLMFEPSNLYLCLIWSFATNCNKKSGQLWRPLYVKVFQLYVGEWRCARDVRVCLFFNAFRLAVRLADIYTPAQRSSPQMNPCVLHAFLVLYRHPNRPHGRQGVRLTVYTCRVHDIVYVFYTQCALYMTVLFLSSAADFDPEENLHSTEGQSHMYVYTIINYICNLS